MHERLDRTDRQPVHHLETGRYDSRPDDRGDRVTCLFQIVEARQHTSRLLRRRRQLDGNLGDDRQQAFRAGDQREQVVTGGIERLAAELDHVAIDQHRAHSPDIVHGQAVLQAVHAAGVFGDVAADRARDLRRRIRRVIQAMDGSRLRYRQIAHARLHDSAAGQRIDRQNALEFRQRQDDALAAGRRTAGQSGAGAARDHRQARRMAQSKDADDLCLVFREQHGERLFAEQRQAVALIGSRPLGRGDDRRRRKYVAKRGKQG